MTDNYELKVGKENGKKLYVNFDDIAKEGIKRSEVAEEFRESIFDKLDKSGNGVLDGNELSMFLEHVEERAKRHNKKNLGKWEYRRVRKNLMNEAQIDLSDVKKKDLLAFIKNLSDVSKQKQAKEEKRAKEQAANQSTIDQTKKAIVENGKKNGFINKKNVQKPSVEVQQPAVEPGKAAQRPEEKAEPQKHKVAEGETLESIAQKYDVPVDFLKNKNGKPLLLKNPAESEERRRNNLLNRKLRNNRQSNLTFGKVKREKIGQRQIFCGQTVQLQQGLQELCITKRV